MFSVRVPAGDYAPQAHSGNDERYYIFLYIGFAIENIKIIK